MKTYVALLRGINVGGHNKLRMPDLVALLADLGLRHVRTYIQSGNVVFQSEEVADWPALGAQISAVIEKSHGFAPRVLILSAAAFQQALVENPFPQAESAPKSLHLYFLASPAGNPDREMLETYKKENEQYVLTDTVFYLYAPDGIGRSNLAERVERALGVPVTARNWRTAGKIMDLVADVVG